MTWLNPPRAIAAIPGHEGYYAGDDGHIYTSRGKPGALRRLAAYSGHKGYLSVRLYDGKGGRVSKRVHVLVCTTFHGPSGSYLVRHLDGDRLNNRPANLQWGTRRENYQDWLHHQEEAAYREACGPLPDQHVEGVPF